MLLTLVLPGLSPDLTEPQIIPTDLPPFPRSSYMLGHPLECLALSVSPDTQVFLVGERRGLTIVLLPSFALLWEAVSGAPLVPLAR